MAQNGASGAGYVGAATNVVLFIKADQNATFKIQVAATPAPNAGRNAFNVTQVPDGGLDWYDFHESGSAAAAASFSTTSATPSAFDLSPFAPQLVRLVRTDGGAAATVTAILSANGSN